MIAADENLLALHLMPPGDPRRPETLRRLVGWVNNYRLPIPSAQRLFLMSELKAMDVKPEFPTYEAELLLAPRVEPARFAGIGPGVITVRPARNSPQGQTRNGASKGPTVMAAIHAQMEPSTTAIFSA